MKDRTLLWLFLILLIVGLQIGVSFLFTINEWDRLYNFAVSFGLNFLLILLFVYSRRFGVRIGIDRTNSH